MKRNDLLVAALIGAAPLAAIAQCVGAQLTSAAISSLVTGNTVCGRAVKPGYPGDANDRWQEEHLPGGELFDYKQGPCSLGVAGCVDPRKQVGTWRVGSGSQPQVGTITHVYSPTVAYIWEVFGPAVNSPGVSVYSFCTTGAAKVEQVRAFIVASGSGCGSYPPPD